MFKKKDKGEKDYRNLPRNRGGGRKPVTQQKLKAIKVYDENAEEIAKRLVDGALGGLKEVSCPACKKKFKVEIPGDSKLLIQVDDRLHGKPVAKQEVDLNAKLELSTLQLVKYRLLVEGAVGDVSVLDVSDTEERLKLLPERVDG